MALTPHTVTMQEITTASGAKVIKTTNLPTHTEPTMKAIKAIDRKLKGYMSKLTEDEFHSLLGEIRFKCQIWKELMEDEYEERRKKK